MITDDGEADPLGVDGEQAHDAEGAPMSGSDSRGGVQ